MNSRADQYWGFWPLLPLYPYGRRRTLLSELIPGQLWSLEQLQGVYYVAVPVRLTVARPVRHTSYPGEKSPFLREMLF